jgi:RNA polymerase sigma factor (sigma-70 family)
VKQHSQFASHLRSLLSRPPFARAGEGEGEGDSALLQYFVETGNGEAFARLVARHGPMVLGLARRTVRDHQLAEDVFQAAFLVLAKKASAIRGRDSLAAWLHSVTFRIALRVRKSQERLRGLPAPARTVADPLDELTAREYLTIIDEELQRLPEKYRLPLVLCLCSGLTQEEAAGRLHLCPGTLKGRLERGRRQLRRRLARRGLTLGATLAALVPLDPALAVPTALLESTRQAAVSGRAAPAIMLLTRWMLRLLLLERIWNWAVFIVVTALVVGWAGWGSSLFGTPPVVEPEQVAVAPPIAEPVQRKGLDLHGDPLPKDAVMRLGTVQYRAGGATLALRPDGQTLVGLRGGRVISFWDVATGKLRETRELPTRQDWGSSLSSDGRWLVTEYNRVLEVWDIDSSKLVHKLPCKDRVESKNLSPDGKQLASVEGRQGYLVRVWDLPSGKETFSKKVESQGSSEYVAFTPDGKKLIASFASADVGILCWDLVTGEQLWQNKRNFSLGRGTAFSADGRILLSTNPPLVVATGQSAPDKLPVLEWGTQVLATADGRTLLISGPHGVMVWDLQTAKEVRRLSGAGEDMVLAPDGKTLITNSGALQRWDVASGEPLYADTFQAGHCEEVQGVVFSVEGEGKRLGSAAGDGSVRLWDLATGQPVHVWQAHQSRRPLNLWHTRHQGVQALEMTPDGRFLASAGSDEFVRVMDTAAGKELCSFKLPGAGNGEHDRVIYHLRLSADGQHASAVFGAQGHTFSTNGPFPEITDWYVRWDLPSGNVALRQPLGKFGGHASGLSRDGKTLVTAASIVHTRSAKQMAPLEGVDQYHGLAPYVLSADGSLIAGDFSEKKKDATWPAGVAVWETATGKLVARLKTKSWSGQLLFHPSGRYLAVNDLDGIHLFDIAAAKKLWTRKLPERVRASTTPGTYSSCFAFSPDGKRMATGLTDGTILLWEVDLPAASEVRLDAKEVEALWADLQDADAAKAWRAVWRLAAAAEDAVPFFRNHLKPVAPAPADVTAALLADLNSDAFAKRDAASKRLKDLGLLAENALRDRLKAQPTLELRQRIEPLLKAIEETPPAVGADTLRDLRAVAALARMPASQSRTLLVDLTRGVASAPVTTAARGVVGQ